MTEEFALNSTLQADSRLITRLVLCDVRLVNDANYPWLLLIPRKPGLVELLDLDEPDRMVLMSELSQVMEALRAATDCHKLNVAALGNQVPQLHVHVIGRFEDDLAWPGPVWGAAKPSAYESHHRDERVSALLAHLEDRPTG